MSDIKQSLLILFLTILSIVWVSPAPSESLRKQDFSNDPGWEAVNNRIDPTKAKEIVQDFGYSKTHNAGGQSAGEIGGRITRALTKASYSKVIPEKTLEDRLVASGKFACTDADGGSAMLFGWFNSESDGWRTPNSLAFRLDGNGGKYWVFFEYGTQEYGTGGGETFEGERYQTTPTPPEKSDGTVHEWSLSYDPEGANGRGEMTFEFDGETFTTQLREGHKQQGAVFNRFGIFNQMTTGNHMNVYFDDLEIHGEREGFDQDPKWEEDGNRTTYTDLIVRPYHNFGYSETSIAGGEPGELGGVIWRIENQRPENSGYYGDDIGKLTLEERLEASGKVSMTRAGADSAALIGWFNSNSFREGPTPRNFFGIMVEGPSRTGHYFRSAYSNDKILGEIEERGPIIRPDGKQYDWTFRYDPEANSGNGEIVVTLGDEQTILPMRPDAREGGAEFDRFGLLPYLQGGHHVEIFFDDISYTVGD